MSKCYSIDGKHRDVPVVLAPMAGYTDAAFRILCVKFGASMVFSEITNAAGLVHGSKRTMHLLETMPGEHPITAHIYGCDADVMAQAALIIESLDRFDSIDINAGCPVRKIVAKGCGVALMKEPARLEQIVRAVTESVRLPVTVKTRIGLSAGKLDVFDTARAVEQGGASAIFVHARFASARHSGAADWDVLAQVKSKMSIPVIGNGGIECAEDALEMIAQTGVDGVMIGRAAVGNPWIFRQIRYLLKGEPYQELSVQEIKSVITEHVQALIALKEKERAYRRRSSLPAEIAAVRHFRGHLYRYLSGTPGWGRYKRQLNELKTFEDMMTVVNGVLKEL